jgi:hypothetical protein
MSGTVTPDSFASCRSLARLNWIIDTTTQPDPDPTEDQGCLNSSQEGSFGRNHAAPCQRHHVKQYGGGSLPRIPVA